MSTSNKLATLFAGLILGAASFAANATVVYHWTTVFGAEYFEPLDGTLEISDAAWRAGSLSYDFTQYDGFPGDPDSPIVASLFSVSTEGFNLGIAIWPPSGTNLLDSSLSAQLGFDRATGLLTGSLYANNTDSDYAMSSNASGTLWTITAFNTDATLGWGCGITGTCSGATGFWKIDAGTIPVPEPTALGLSLLGLGLLVSAMVLRRKCGRANP